MSKISKKLTFPWLLQVAKKILDFSRFSMATMNFQSKKFHVKIPNYIETLTRERQQDTNKEDKKRAQSVSDEATAQKNSNNSCSRILLLEIKNGSSLYRHISEYRESHSHCNCANQHFSRMNESLAMTLRESSQLKIWINISLQTQKFSQKYKKRELKFRRKLKMLSKTQTVSGNSKFRQKLKTWAQNFVANSKSELNLVQTQHLVEKSKWLKI